MRFLVRAALIPLALLGAATLTTQQSTASATAPPMCSLNTGLKATMRYSGAGGMQYFYELVFANSGGHACRLFGFPGAQPVVGAKHEPVGGDSLHQSPPAPRVVLRARTGVAHSRFSAWVVAIWPARICRPHPTDGVLVHLPGGPAFYLKSPNGTLQVCAAGRRGQKGHSTSVGPFGAGAY